MFIQSVFTDVIRGNLKLRRVRLPKPKFGGKGWLLDQFGLFILEEKSALIRNLLCTHAGSGTIRVIDGVPDERGYFPDEAMSEDDDEYDARNGREVFRAVPTIMGAWMADVACYHGLTVVCSGGTHAVPPTVTIVWMES